MGNRPPSVRCHPFNFTITIKQIVPEPKPDDDFTVSANGGQNLLEVMKQQQKFSIKTKDLPNSGAYVVEVDGTANEADRFWNTVLYDKSTKEVKPISLWYKPRQNDVVYLRYSQF